MAEYRGQRYDALVLHIRVANPAGFNTNKNFALLKIIELDFLQAYFALGLSDNCCGCGDQRLHLIANS